MNLFKEVHLKGLILFLSLFLTQLAIGQRIDNLTDKYPHIQELHLSHLNRGLLNSPKRFSLFLHEFFRDFASHPKTKIKKIIPIKCKEVFCYNIILDYHFGSGGRERRTNIESFLTIKLKSKSAIVLIKNKIPKAMKFLVEITPESWTEDFPLMKEAKIHMEENSKGLDLTGTIWILNKVKRNILQEFMNDFLSSFYFHLRETAEIQ